MINRNTNSRNRIIDFVLLFLIIPSYIADMRIGDLPKDLVEYTIEFAASKYTLATVPCVCKSWKRLLSDVHCLVWLSYAKCHSNPSSFEKMKKASAHFKELYNIVVLNLKIEGLKQLPDVEQKLFNKQLFVFPPCFQVFSDKQPLVVHYPNDTSLTNYFNIDTNDEFSYAATLSLTQLHGKWISVNSDGSIACLTDLSIGVVKCVKEDKSGQNTNAQSFKIPFSDIFKTIHCSKQLLSYSSTDKDKKVSTLLEWDLETKKILRPIIVNCFVKKILFSTPSEIIFLSDHHYRVYFKKTSIPCIKILDKKTQKIRRLTFSIDEESLTSDNERLFYYQNRSLHILTCNNEWNLTMLKAPAGVLGNLHSLCPQGDYVMGIFYGSLNKIRIVVWDLNLGFSTFVRYDLKSKHSLVGVRLKMPYELQVLSCDNQEQSSIYITKYVPK
jgi:hypothetical protein